MIQNKSLAYRTASAATFISCLVAALILFRADNASAQFSVFDTEMFAQLHCPTDEIVWLDHKKRRYYLAKHRLYGVGKNATYACRKEANRSGYRVSRTGFR